MFAGDCANPFIVMIVGFVGFVAWINLFRIAHAVFPKIKEHQPELYAKILLNSGKTWLERGWYSPSDLVVQIRLYIAIYHGKTMHILSAGSQRMFVWSARIFVLASIIFIVSSVALITCLYSNVGGA